MRSNKATKKYKALGLGIEIWILIFAVIASVPLLNMFALPAILIAFSIGVSIYLLWKAKY